MKTIDNPAYQMSLVHVLASALNDALKMVIPFGDMDDHQKAILRKASAALDRYVAVYGEDAFPEDAK